MGIFKETKVSGAVLKQATAGGKLCESHLPSSGAVKLSLTRDTLRNAAVSDNVNRISLFTKVEMEKELSKIDMRKRVISVLVVVTFFILTVLSLIFDRGTSNTLNAVAVIFISASLIGAGFVLFSTKSKNFL